MRIHHYFITIILFFTFQSQAQDDETYARIDSLSDIVYNTQHLTDTVYLNSLSLLSEDYFESTPDSTISISKRVVKFVDFKLKSNPKSTLRKFYLESKSTAINNIGAVFLIQGDLPKSLEYFHKSLAVDEALGDDANIAVGIGNVGYVYYLNKEYDQALDYFQQAIKYRIKAEDTEGMATDFNNIGLVYYQKNDFDKAYDYFIRSLKLEEKFGNKAGLPSSYGNIAALLERQNAYKQAIQLYQRALELQIELGNKEGEALMLHNIGMSYNHYGDYSEAEKYTQQSLIIAQELDYPKSIGDASSLLSLIYKKTEKHKEALEMFELFVENEKKIKNIEVEKALIEQKLEYEYTKKEALVKANHNADLEIKDAEEKKSNTIIWSITIGLILTFFFAVIIVVRLRINTKQKKIIADKNKENELLLGEIHHRVKNNLQIISSLLSLQERSMTDEAAKAAIIEGKERVQSMGLIHKLLYQENNFSGIEMNNYINKLTQGLLSTFGKDDESIQLNIQFEELIIDIDTAVPLGLIINELIVNTLKYAFSNVDNPELSITLIENDNKLILQLSDNGKGKKISIEQSNSFGMKLVRSLTRQLSGSIKIEENDGMHFTIEINDYKTLNECQ